MDNIYILLNIFIYIKYIKGVIWQQSANTFDTVLLDGKAGFLFGVKSEIG